MNDDEDPICKEKRMTYQWEIDDRGIVTSEELENQCCLWRQRWGRVAEAMKKEAEERVIRGERVVVETGKIMLPNGEHETTGMGLIRRHGGVGVLVDTVRVVSRGFEDTPIRVRVEVGPWVVCDDLMRERDVFPLEPPVFVEERDNIKIDGGVGSMGPRSVELEGVICRRPGER